MLTIQSNLKIPDLETLANTLTKPDIINFGLNKVGGGYTYEIADKVIAKLSKLDKNKIIVIINDITLQMADKLLEAGYKNIYLAFGRFNKDGSISKDKTVYNIMKAVIKNNIKEKLNIILLEEIFNMKIDGVIANVPYGAIGANIAYTIRDKVDYEYFVNLLPANDYKRNKTKDLFNYQSEMEAINDGFDDAAVTTHLALIHENKVNNMTAEEFEISNYTDKKLNKYFNEQISRSFEIKYTTNTPIEQINKLDISKTIILGAKDVNHKHLPYSKKCVQYRWNVTEDVNANWVKEHYACVSSKKENQTSLFVIYLDSAEEKKALVELLYGEVGFKFIQKLWTAINIDSYCMPDKYLPKLKLYSGITWEEILKDYGYTEEEIAEVMADLDNFKGMED